MPGRRAAARAGAAPALFDFRPVLRNRSAFAYSLAYCVHTLEMNALRGWGVAFLAWVAASTATRASCCRRPWSSPCSGLLGTADQRARQRGLDPLRPPPAGRRRRWSCRSSIGAVIGFVGSTGYWIAVGLIVLYGMIIWLDSSSLTAGAAGAADPARRGATLAVHSMLGYAGGFVGPARDRLDARSVGRHVARRAGGCRSW